jgi:antitoxin PrlF
MGKSLDVAARITSNGRVTLPKPVRDGLGLREGDQVIFRIDGSRVVLSRASNLLDLAGTVPVSPGKRGLAWERIRSHARQARMTGD